MDISSSQGGEDVGEGARIPVHVEVCLRATSTARHGDIEASVAQYLEEHTVEFVDGTVVLDDAFLREHTDKVRVAGTAEFAGYNHDIRPSRIATLKRMVLKSFPQLEANILEATEWACLRPSTPDGAPLLGKTPIENLYLNTGHGTLGWTLGVGSARIVADQSEGKTPEIDLTGLTMERYL